MAELTRARVDAEHYVARYAQGKLSDAEQQAFEEFCLLHPELVEQVGTDERLMEGLRALETKRAPRSPRVAIYALAASIAVAAFGIAFWMRAAGPAPDALYRAGVSLPEPAARQVSRSRRVVLLRTGAVLNLTVPAGTTALPLKIEPAVTHGSSTLRVTLAEEIDGSWRPRGTVEAAVVSQGEEAAVDVVVDLTKLTSAHLRVTLDTEDGMTDEFELHIVRSPTT